MAASYPKSHELQAFENWARDKTWFKKTKGHFGRNGNDTGYTHYTVNDRANAFLAGINHAELEQVCGLIKSWPDFPDAHLAQPAQAVDAWMTDDGRVISDRQKATAIRDGGASASSVAPYIIPLTRALPNANGKEG